MFKFSYCLRRYNRYCKFLLFSFRKFYYHRKFSLGNAFDPESNSYVSFMKFLYWNKIVKKIPGSFFKNYTNQDTIENELFLIILGVKV